MIETSREGRILTLRIARPDRAGALTGAMLWELADAVENAGWDDGLCGVILTGTGRVFSAGADLGEVRDGTLATDPVWERLSGAVAACPLPVVAALNGPCAGGALGMVLACDMRVAVPAARFFYPVMKMGVMPQPSDPARNWGLVDRVVENAESEARALLGPAEAAARERVVALKAVAWS